MLLEPSHLPTNPLLQLLLRPQLISMPTFLLATICRTWRKSCVAFSADHLVAIILGGEGFEGWFDDTAAEAQDEMKGGFLLNVVIGQCTPILQLLSRENQALLVWWDSLLVLDLGLDIVDGVAGFDF